MKRLLNKLIIYLADNLVYSEVTVARTVNTIIVSIHRCETAEQLYRIENLTLPKMLYYRFERKDYVPYLHLIESALQRRRIFVETGVLI